MAWKLRIVRGLDERGYTRQDILELFRVIDWMMMLPADPDQAFHYSLEQYEGETRMPYITSIERNAIEKGREEGREQGLRQAIVSALLVRFECVPDGVRDAIERVSDLEALTRLLETAIRAESMEEFQQNLPIFQS